MGRPRIGRGLCQRVTMTISGEIVERLDTWRRRDPRKPSRSSAARSLLALALDRVERDLFS